MGTENHANSSDSYLLEKKEEGIFLTIYPPKDGVALDIIALQNILKEQEIDSYDNSRLENILQEASGKAELLIAHSPKEEPPSWMDFRIEVAKDRMSASLKIKYDNEKLLPTIDMIMERISSEKITVGVLDKEEIEKKLAHEDSFVVAEGIAPIPGKDAFIEKKFSFADKGVPEKNQYDQVDYKNLNLFILAKKGQVLAVRTPHTEGTAGTDIFGNSVAARVGKSKPLLKGKNTYIEDDNILYAAIDGQIMDVGNKISIDPHLDISSDVGVATGNIDFTGSVTIKGNVEAGFVVKATGDIEIKGTISGGTVSGLNVLVGGGIQGAAQGKVTAKEDVRATFAENAYIEAGHIIHISDVSLHSQLKAGKKIILEGKRGMATGGSLSAGEEIQAKVIGNPMFVITRLAVGIDPMLQQRYQEACKAFSEAQKALSQLKKSLVTLEKIDLSKLPPARLEQVQKLRRSEYPLIGDVERNKKLIEELDQEMQNRQQGKIRVLDILYPGARISINSVLKNIQSQERNCLLRVADEEIKVFPL